MNPLDIISVYYPPGSRVRDIFLRHGEAVAGKALAAAERVTGMPVDTGFVYEAAMLHDIGMVKTDSPTIGCTGTYPYLCHGYLGRELLDAHGLRAHGLVCERHVGVGITRAEIVARGFPLPPRDMVPESMEEQVVCYADKFFSKNGGGHQREKPLADILTSLSRYGPGKVETFLQWHDLFG